MNMIDEIYVAEQSKLQIHMAGSRMFIYTKKIYNISYEPEVSYE